MLNLLKGRLLALALCTMLSVPYSYSAEYSQGANDKEIKIGNTAPYSGPAAPYGKAYNVIDAYFKMVNDNGGINGRKIIFLSKDDSYNPAKTVEQTRRLVESEGVLLMFNQLGTAPNLAVRSYLNEKKIPQIFAASGDSQLDKPKEFPWTIRLYPSYFHEGKFIGAYIKKKFPAEKIVIKS